MAGSMDVLMFNGWGIRSQSHVGVVAGQKLVHVLKGYGRCLLHIVVQSGNSLWYDRGAWVAPRCSWQGLQLEVAVAQGRRYAAADGVHIDCG